jgi:hypothetical protein
VSLSHFFSLSFESKYFFNLTSLNFKLNIACNDPILLPCQKVAGNKPLFLFNIGFLIPHEGHLDEPIVINRETKILSDGYRRYIMAKKEKMDVVPVSYEKISAESL